MNFVVLVWFSFIISVELRKKLKLTRNDVIKKHIKRLKKQEGGVRLVGGRGEYEGNFFIFSKLYPRNDFFIITIHFKICNI